MIPTTLTIRCPKHPTYKGLRPPRVECEECDWIRAHKGMFIIPGLVNLTVGGKGK